MKIEANIQKMYTEGQVLDIICHILGCDIEEAKNCMKSVYTKPIEVIDIKDLHITVD